MSNFDLDDRMTDETKAFVTNVLKSMRPADSVHVDVNLSRKFRIANALRVNGGLTFADVIVQNFKVINQEDAHEIPIVAFIPKSPKQDSPITIVNKLLNQLYNFYLIKIIFFQVFPRWRLDIRQLRNPF